ncbi:MAG: extracellular solute-binding protein [Patescibacteria group bacterium]|nr:extracellular solute-binding protein [Patescibacteria group bacterium]MDE1940637.1 extracellular solute-binding protein [Patescibacteria group bacterium]MDE1966885.1 extracellular solute-binding protein [Patescibacteria group bacterium]
MTKFQIITLAIFVVCIIVGVAAFALYKGSGPSTSLPPITIWGTFPASTFDQYVSDINSASTNQLSISYVEKDPSSFANDFVNALATGQGPDAILIPADMILPEENKITPVPYSALPQRTFMDTYVQEAQTYLTADGILAVPFTLDPLVMYWNRDMFNAAGLATYPRYWDEFTGTDLNPGLVQKLTVKDQNANIRQSAIAMGSFSNMTNAREVLGSLLMQLGNPITAPGQGGAPVSALGSDPQHLSIPGLQYFAQFADPASTAYSWNASLPNDKSQFLAGALATYFGFASEIADLRAKNPNLNFDVAALPQLRSGGQKAAYGRMYGFSLVHTSAKQNEAFQIISILTSPQHIAQLSKTMYIPPVQTSLIAQGSSDPYMTIFDQEALISRTWLDAGPAASSQVFSSMIGSIVSGQKQPDQAVRDASDQYNVILQQAQQ